VFVGKLPKNLNESHIYEVFITVGRIFQIRLMMDFTGTNRGFCFVQYYNPSDASRAIKELNHYQITQRKISVNCFYQTQY
jgi:RNA recognition motif-containing protein